MLQHKKGRASGETRVISMSCGTVKKADRDKTNKGSHTKYGSFKKKKKCSNITKESNNLGIIPFFGLYSVKGKIFSNNIFWSNNLNLVCF